MRYAFLSLLLLSCVSTHKTWVNPSTTAGFKSDLYECERDARVVSQPGGRGLFRERDATVSVDKKFRAQCLESKGWEELEETDEQETARVADLRARKASQGAPAVSATTQPPR